MNRAWRKVFSILAIAAVLFAQLAVSAYACPMQTALVNCTDMQMEAAATAGDDEPVAQPALCLKHCQNEQQNRGDPDASLASVALAPAFTLALPQVAGDSKTATTISAPSLQHPISPPLAIRHCCFRI